MVYVARNPKDVIVSYFYYHRILAFHQYTGDFDSFVEYFMKDEGKCILNAKKKLF